MTVKPVKVSKLIEVERILDFEEASFFKKKKSAQENKQASAVFLLAPAGALTVKGGKRQTLTYVWWTI